MKWILVKFDYDIEDSYIKNKLCNNFDYVFSVLYFLISLYNAWICAYTVTFFDEDGKFMLTSITTFLVIAINIVVLFRLYIKLHIQSIDEENNIKANLNINERYDKIIIESLQRRKELLRNVWLICFVIISFVWFYGDIVVKSVGLLAVVCASLTLLNDLMDIAINKYSAKIKSGTLKYIKQR